MTILEPARKRAAEIVRDAGGQIVGRTRLQKVAYLLELAGLGGDFNFEYRHYGPYSEELADAIQIAKAFGLVTEEEKRASWGGTYSIYLATADAGRREHGLRAEFAERAAMLGSIELELAATAAYLSAVDGDEDPWTTTAELKPEKAVGNHLTKAKIAYRELCRLSTPRRLPDIA